MRKRRTFADPQVMETTFANYCLNYQNIQPIKSLVNVKNTTDFSDFVEIKQVEFEHETINSQPPTTSTTTSMMRPKISFSIESIIGIK